MSKPTPARKRNRVDNPLKKSRFDFKLLNQQFNSAWQLFKAQRDEGARLALYQATYDLAWACLRVSKFCRNPENDLHLITTEFSFNQLNRMLAGTLVPESLREGTLFPANHYFSLAILDTAHKYFKRDYPTKSWQRLHTLIDDFDLFMRDNSGSISGENDYDATRTEKIMESNDYSRSLLRALRLLYSDDDIRRMLPLACELLFISKLGSPGATWKAKTDAQTTDLKTFIDVLIVCAQRVAVSNEITQEINLPKNDLKKLLDSSLRSTLFLSAVTNFDCVPRDLLLALDHRSLYRLAYILGGRTIRIPSVRDLQTLQNAVNAAASFYMAPEKERKEVMGTIVKYDKVFAKKATGYITTEGLVSKIIESNKILRDDTTSPLINVVLSGIQALDTLVKQIHEKQIRPDQTLEQYVALSKSLTDIVDRIIALEKNYDEGPEMPAHPKEKKGEK